MKTPFTATAIWLRDAGGGCAEVLLEIEGVWRTAISTYIGKTDNTFGHIADGNGQNDWPIDRLAKSDSGEKV